MSILDVRKCKNSDISSLFDKKSVDDPKDTANIFNIFLLTLVRLATEKETTLVNHSPSFFLNYAESIYFSLTYITRNLDFIGSMNFRKSFSPCSVPITILKIIREMHQVFSTFSYTVMLLQFTSGNFPDKLKLTRIE